MTSENVGIGYKLLWTENINPGILILDKTVGLSLNLKSSVETGTHKNIVIINTF